jgi:hypothetical protein
VHFEIHKVGLRFPFSTLKEHQQLGTQDNDPLVFSNFSQQWKNNFYPRDLMALSVHPLLMYPSHYARDAGYISDTEHIDTTHVHDEL